eukprot:ANDGO_04607.mRNA.1 Cathepsin B-like cysteine proteinase
MIKAIVLVVALSAVAFALSDSDRILNDARVAELNADTQSTWTAGRNDRLEGMSVSQFKKLLGSRLTNGEHGLPIVDPITLKDIPTSFDWRQQTPNCVGAVRDQGHCGSCWAVSTVETLSDRFCIQSKGQNTVQVCSQDLVSCSSAGSCDGGYPSAAWDWLSQNGSPSEPCYPSEMGTCQHPGCSEEPTPACNTAKTCKDSSPYTLYYAASSYGISSNVAKIQTEIQTHGPVTVAFSVYEDFAHYKSGIYQHKSGQFLGGHAVEMIGWGVENNVPYWIIKNSWNTSWGENGYFRILRGKNECGIESEVVAGLAKV